MSLFKVCACLLLQSFEVTIQLTDAIKKLLEVIIGRPLLQPLVIQSKALDQIIAQTLGSPLPEECPLLRLNTIPYRDNDIKVVVGYLIGLPITGSCCKICNN